MKHPILALIVFLSVGLGVALPADPATKDQSKVPSEKARVQIEQRRENLSTLYQAALDEIPVRPRDDSETSKVILKAWEELETALDSTDPFVFRAIASDIGLYRKFDAQKVLQLLLPRMKTPEKDDERVRGQSALIEYVGRAYGPKAAEALPQLLAIVVDKNLATRIEDGGRKINMIYINLRSAAVKAVARIAPGDKRVVDALIEALNNLNRELDRPYIHGDIVGHLGEMGQAALPARKALLKNFDRADFYYQDNFVALGKIGRDKPSRPLKDYLAILESIDKNPAEEVAVAFHHVVAEATTDRKVYKKFLEPRSEEVKETKPDVVMAVRPILLKIIEDRPDDIFSRAAIRALGDIGPGSSPRATKAIAACLLRERAEKETTGAVDLLRRVEPTEPEAVLPLIEAFKKTVGTKDSWPLTEELAKAFPAWGIASRPVAPTLLKAMQEFHSTFDANLLPHLFPPFAFAVSACAPDDDNARKVVLELLDPKGDFLTKAGKWTLSFQKVLLLTLARIGIPKEGEDRSKSLKFIQQIAKIDTHDAIAVAAYAAKAIPNPTKVEIDPILHELVRALDPKFELPELPPLQLSTTFFYRLGMDWRVDGTTFTLQAMEALGPLAKVALPQVQRLADRKLVFQGQYDQKFRQQDAITKLAQKVVAAILEKPPPQE